MIKIELWKTYILGFTFFIVHNYNHPILLMRPFQLYILNLCWLTFSCPICTTGNRIEVFIGIIYRNLITLSPFFAKEKVAYILSCIFIMNLVVEPQLFFVWFSKQKFFLLNENEDGWPNQTTYKTSVERIFLQHIFLFKRTSPKLTISFYLFWSLFPFFEWTVN